MKVSSHLWPGVPLALGSAALFGALAPLCKLLLDRFEPQMLAGTLYLGAGIGLGLIALARRVAGAPAAEAPLRRGDAPWLAAIVLFGGVLGPLALMLGLNATDAANAALLLNLEGLATMAIAWLVFRENVDRRLLLGAAAILLGAVALSWRGRGVSLDTGAVLVAAACLSWGVDNNLTRKLSSADPATLAMIKGFFAGGVNLAAALLLGARLPGAADLAAAAVLGFVCVGASLVLFIRALRHLGTARTGAYFSLAPFIGAATALAAFNEAPSLQLLVAGGLMGVGVWLHLSERHEHVHEHAPLEHEHSHVHDAHHQHAHEHENGGEPHSHWHSHASLVHSHPHYPDLHHRHRH